MQDNYNIYVEIDSLFDTRFPIAYSINDVIANSYLSSGEYHNRIRDNIGIISYDIFNSIYRKRNKNIFKLSTPTPIFELLQEMCVELRGNMLKVGIEDTHYVYLNTYPYKFNIDEQNNLKTLLEDYLGDSVVKIVYMNNEELNPIWIKEHINHIIKYDTMEWLELHMSNSNIITTPLFNTSFYAPYLVTGNISNKEINNDTFMNMQVLANTIMNLIFINTSMFCLKKE